jgi:hypothetical protein
MKASRVRSIRMSEQQELQSEKPSESSPAKIERGVAWRLASGDAIERDRVEGLSSVAERAGLDTNGGRHE